VDATSCVKMCNAMIGAEELSYILSYQTLSAGKKLEKLLSNHEACYK
jgi:hypothetical protein